MSAGVVETSVEKVDVNVERKVAKVKEKIVIKEREFTNKLCDCTQSSSLWGVGGFVASAVLVPYILSKARFIPTSKEVLAVSGLISSIVGGVATANYRKKSCDDSVKETYTFNRTF